MWSQSFSCINIHTYTFIHTQVAVYWRAQMTHIHTLIPMLDLTYTNTHASGGTSLFSTSRSASLHTRTINCLPEILSMMTDPHTPTLAYTHALLLAQKQIHLMLRSSFTFPGAFPLHATCALISPVWDEST